MRGLGFLLVGSIGSLGVAVSTAVLRKIFSSVKQGNLLCDDEHETLIGKGADVAAPTTPLLREIGDANNSDFTFDSDTCARKYGEDFFPDGRETFDSDMSETSISHATAKTSSPQEESFHSDEHKKGDDPGSEQFEDASPDEDDSEPREEHDTGRKNAFQFQSVLPPSIALTHRASTPISADQSRLTVNETAATSTKKTVGGVQNCDLRTTPPLPSRDTNSVSELLAEDGDAAAAATAAGNAVSGTDTAAALGYAPEKIHREALDERQTQHEVDLSTGIRANEEPDKKYEETKETAPRDLKVHEGTASDQPMFPVISEADRTKRFERPSAPVAGTKLSKKSVSADILAMPLSSVQVLEDPVSGLSVPAAAIVMSEETATEHLWKASNATSASRAKSAGPSADEEHKRASDGDGNTLCSLQSAFAPKTAHITNYALEAHSVGVFEPLPKSARYKSDPISPQTSVQPASSGVRKHASVLAAPISAQAAVQNLPENTSAPLTTSGKSELASMPAIGSERTLLPKRELTVSNDVVIEEKENILADQVRRKSGLEGLFGGRRASRADPKDRSMMSRLSQRLNRLMPSRRGSTGGK